MIIMIMIIMIIIMFLDERLSQLSSLYNEDFIVSTNTF